MWSAYSAKRGITFVAMRPSDRTIWPVMQTLGNQQHNLILPRHGSYYF